MEIGNALVVMAVLGLLMGLTVVMVVLGSREEEPDPNGAEAYALEQLDDEELEALWEEADKDEDREDDRRGDG
ncbi:MAG: hypothetical protein J6L83_05550 [Clostridia bacterium]|nr:hypothetical protein [Clostridia bacterium]